MFFSPMFALGNKDSYHYTILHIKKKTGLESESKVTELVWNGVKDYILLTPRCHMTSFLSTQGVWGQGWQLQICSQFLGLSLRMNLVPLPGRKPLTTHKASWAVSWTFLEISESLETSFSWLITCQGLTEGLLDQKILKAPQTPWRISFFHWCFSLLDSSITLRPRWRHPSWQLPLTQHL